MTSRVVYGAQPSFHPLAETFPLIEGAEFEAFVTDLREHGLREPIILFDGKVLDGRNRLRACHAAGVEPRFGTYEGNDPLAFVISLNLKRRHLNEAQRCMVAARLANMPEGRPSKTSPIGGVSQQAAADLLNVSKRSVERARKVIDEGSPELIAVVEKGMLAVSEAAAAVELPAERQRQVAEKAQAGDANAARAIVKKGRRKAREAELGRRVAALPVKKYVVVLADPEWEFEPYSRETGMDRAAGNHYPTSASRIIAERDVPSISADDGVLFLWATVPMLPDALDVMKAWGFVYKSNFTWVKDKIGTGYWNRNKHEHLLIGTRGKIPAPAMGEQFPSVIEAPAVGHSVKPEAFLEMIESYYPTVPKIELNRRGPLRVGWDAWGNEAGDGES